MTNSALKEADEGIKHRLPTGWKTVGAAPFYLAFCLVNFTFLISEKSPALLPKPSVVELVKAFQINFI